MLNGGGEVFGSDKKIRRSYEIQMQSGEIRTAFCCGEIRVLEGMIHAKNPGSSGRCRAELRA